MCGGRDKPQRFQSIFVYPVLRHPFPRDVLHLQKAPLEVLVAELKVAAGAEAEAEAGSWTSLLFQERVVEELLENPVAERYPPRAGYISRLTKV